MAGYNSYTLDLFRKLERAVVVQLESLSMTACARPDSFSGIPP